MIALKPKVNKSVTEDPEVRKVHEARITKAAANPFERRPMWNNSIAGIPKPWDGNGDSYSSSIR